MNDYLKTVEEVYAEAAREAKADLCCTQSPLWHFPDLKIPTIPSFDLVPHALRLAVTHRRTVYDSVYVALALRAKANLITADERLANALAAHLPVKWLGAL